MVDKNFDLEDPNFDPDKITIEMSENLEKVACFAFDEAAEKLRQAGNFEPFTILLIGENIHIETHPGDTVEQCFDSAWNTVAKSPSATEAYVFCYDGFVETDDDPEADAIIVECADKDADFANVLCKLYTVTDGDYDIDEQIAFLDVTDSMFFEPIEDEDEAEGEEGDECECEECADEAEHKHDEGCGCGCEDAPEAE